MKHSFFFLTIIILVLLSSCKSKEDPETDCIFTEGIAQGTVLNNNWTFREGTAETDGDEFQIFLYETNEINSSDLCAESALNLTATQVTFYVSSTLGSQSIQTATIYNATTAETAVASICWEVSEITSTTITGKIAINTDGNVIDGSFTARICN